MEVTTETQFLNIVICPGCAQILPIENEGCPHCGYEEPDTGRIPTVVDIISSSAMDGAPVFNDVSCAFVARVVEVVQRQMRTIRPMETVPTDGTPVLVVLEKPNQGSWIQAASYMKRENGMLGIVGNYFHFDMPKQIGWLPQPDITDQLPRIGIVGEEKK